MSLAPYLSSNQALNHGLPYPKQLAQKPAMYQQAFNTFQALPDDQQEVLKKEFLEKTNSAVVGQIKDLQRKEKDIFSSPLISSTFKVFLVEQKGF